MRILIIVLLGTLLLAGCSKSEESGADDSQRIDQFFSQLQPWLDGKRGAAEAACGNIAESQLAESEKYAARANKDLCQGALLEHFAFFIPGDNFKLLAVDSVGRAEPAEQEGVWVQPVRLRMIVGGKEKSVLAQSAAVIEDGKIKTLDGMRLSALAPEEFAENLGSGEVIRVDPVSAAYYSANPSPAE